MVLQCIRKESDQFPVDYHSMSPAKASTQTVKSMLPAEVLDHTVSSLGMWQCKPLLIHSFQSLKLVPWGTDGRLPLSGDFRSLIVE